MSAPKVGDRTTDEKPLGVDRHRVGTGLLTV
jgi:hypothetical protein